MTRRFLPILLGFLLLGSMQTPAAQVDDTLRACSPPNNLPFSNRAEEGFENKLAELVAEEFDTTIQHTWRAQRRGFLRNTLGDNQCDVVMGIPTSVDRVLTTKPYYRSTYVFVYRQDAEFEIESFDDSTLHDVQIGVHLVGDDGANPPPVHALAQRGVVDNVIGYRLYADYSESNPLAEIVEDVANETIDVAIVWGPRGGYFAEQQPVDLKVVPVSPEVVLPFRPMVFDVSMGVARGDSTLAEALDQVIDRRQEEIDRLLEQYDVPLMETGAGQPSPQQRPSNQRNDSL